MYVKPKHQVAFSLQKKNYLEEATEGNQDTSLLSPLLFWVKRARDKHNKNAKIQDVTLQRIFWKMCITQKGEKNLFGLKTDLRMASCSDLRVNWFHRNCFCINASVTCDKRLCTILCEPKAPPGHWLQMSRTLPNKSTEPSWDKWLNDNKHSCETNKNK